MFSWQTQYLTSEHSERVRYCVCHSNIKFMSSRHCVISSMYTLFFKNKNRVREKFYNAKFNMFSVLFSETIFIFQDGDCQERKKQKKTGCDLQMKRSQSLKRGSESTNSAWKKFHSFSRLNLFCLDFHTLLDC